MIKEIRERLYGTMKNGIDPKEIVLNPFEYEELMREVYSINSPPRAEGGVMLLFGLPIRIEAANGQQ